MRYSSEINECMYDNGGCQYDCMNLAGGYECGCPMGMFLAEDGFHCVVKCYTCHNVEDEADCYLEVSFYFICVFSRLPLLQYS